MEMEEVTVMTVLTMSVVKGVEYIKIIEERSPNKLEVQVWRENSFIDSSWPEG